MSDNLVSGECANEVLVHASSVLPNTTVVNGSPYCIALYRATVERLVLFHDVQRYEKTSVRKRVSGEP